MTRVTTFAALAGLCSITACSHKSDITAPTDTTAVGSCTSVALAIGEVATTVAGRSICVGAGASSATYVMIPFLNSSGAASKATVTFSATGTTLASGNATTPLGARSPSEITGGWPARQSPARAAFDVQMRRRERRELSPLMASARRWLLSPGQAGRAARSAIPTTLVPGDLLQLNANGDDQCTNPKFRTGRVVAVTDRAVVVTDQGNPSGGYTDAELQSLGVTFDTLVDPLDRQNFGDPTDIDGNKHVLLFFTKTVNDLTPLGSDTFIGGYFAARDLFPVQSTSELQGCAGSNVGEMFYLIVPDPSRGSFFSKTNVTSIAIGTLAHEYQHLINASRRLYVNTAAEDFEEVWLNEGLSHIAEELLFYRMTKLAPRTNITAATIRQSNATVDAFNHIQLANIDNYGAYLEAPSGNSPFSDNDSLETRGATWSYLRYAADHSTKAEQLLWTQLVNSPATGFVNLQQVLGTSGLTVARDWATSVLTDDLVSTSAAYQQPSWNIRNIMVDLRPSALYPLQPVLLHPGVPVSLSIVAGSAGYVAATVPAGTTATITWGTLPANVQLSVVRTK